MKNTFVIICLVLAVAASFVGGFWLGFRQAWTLAPMADTGPRGVTALYLLRDIEAGRVEDAKERFHSDIDAGLLFWHEITQSRLYPILNELSGTTINPSYEEYVRPLASYRKAHPSPLWSPILNAEIEKNISRADPALARALEDSARAAQADMQAVIDQYAQ